MRKSTHARAVVTFIHDGAMCVSSVFALLVEHRPPKHRPLKRYLKLLVQTSRGKF